MKQADRKDWPAFVDGWQGLASTGWGAGVKRIVPWGVLGLEGLLRACCARWWATSDRGSHKARERSPGGQRKEKPEEQRKKLGRWRKNRNKPWVRGKEMGRQRIQAGTKKKKRRKNRGTRKANYGPGVQRGRWGTAMVWFVWKHSNPILLLYYCYIFVCINGPHKAQTRPLECSGAEVGASLATKSRTVMLRFRLTVANCPTQGCTIRRFCWDDQHDQKQVQEKATHS